MRKPLELAIVQAVAAWREREARERNVPRGRIIKDDTIAEIAQQQPRDAEALGRLRSIPKGWERSAQAAGLVTAIQSALAIAKEDLPKSPKPSHSPEGSAAAADILKVLLKLVTEEHGVAAKIVANSDDIEKDRRGGRQGERPCPARLATRGFRPEGTRSHRRQDRHQV